MLRTVLAAVLALSLFAVCTDCLASDSLESRPVYQQPYPHNTSYRIDLASGTCSGSAIAESAVLTATHCFDNENKLALDTEKLDIVARLDDGNDHTILIVNKKFTKIAMFGPKVRQGDDIFYWGNPTSYNNLLRRGYVAGWDRDSVIYDVNVKQGDSGATIFDASGRVVGIVSIRHNDDGFIVMQSFPMNFTEQQLRTAGVNLLDPNARNALMTGIVSESENQIMADIAARERMELWINENGGQNYFLNMIFGKPMPEKK